MTRLTRRGMFGLGAGGLVAACVSDGSVSRSRGAFNHGVASGDVSQTGGILWTRVTPAAGGPVTVSWIVARDQAFKEVVKRGLATTGPERDYTVKVDVDGLAANTRYFYGFVVGQTPSSFGVLKTLPASGTAPFKLAVVSCANWPFGYFNAYREIANRQPDAVIELGDYIYEGGGPGSYGFAEGQALQREHTPPRECVSLADYRARFAQYRSDPDLQAAHAACPWFCTWDDHETANNSYQTGAASHDPNTEGSWEARKAAAVQAYLEWMPVRDPVPGRARESIYRKFDIGDLATLFLMETRLIARSDDLDPAPILNLPENQRRAAADQLMTRVNDPRRTLMGAEQEAWLADGMKQSAASGKKWQVLGNQVLMAKVKSPDLMASPIGPRLKPDDFFVRFYQTGKYGVPWNLDTWCGFPAARERLYAAAKAANAKMVVLAGDTHAAWANELHDKDGHRMGVEFACTSITSSSPGDSIPYRELNWLMQEANDEVVWYNAFDKGFTLVTLEADRVEADYIKVSNIKTRGYSASSDARFVATAADIGMNQLSRPMGGGGIIRG